MFHWRNAFKRDTDYDAQLREQRYKAQIGRLNEKIKELRWGFNVCSHTHACIHTCKRFTVILILHKQMYASTRIWPHLSVNKRKHWTDEICLKKSKSVWMWWESGPPVFPPRLGRGRNVSVMCGQCSAREVEKRVRGRKSERTNGRRKPIHDCDANELFYCCMRRCVCVCVHAWWCASNYRNWTQSASTCSHPKVHPITSNVGAWGAAFCVFWLVWIFCYAVCLWIKFWLLSPKSLFSFCQ